MKPLAGVRVVEAASYVSVPFASLALSDLGADVIKVEPPGGDPFRRFGLRHQGQSLSWLATNANKRSTVIDLKTETGVARLHDLLADADVLMTNWRPAVAARLGLEPAAVQARYPRLVWVRLSGYGQDGPQADLPAFDAIIQARSGLAMSNGDEPRLLPGYVADKVSAMFAAQAAMAALVGRATTGEGAVVDVAMIDSLAYFDGPDVLAGKALLDAPDYDVIGHLGDMRPLRTEDGWLLVSPVSGKQLKRALAAAGRPDAVALLRAVEDARTMTSMFLGLLAEVLPSRPTAEWEQVFADADVPASAVLSVDDHVADHQLAHNATFRVTEDPILGRVRQVRHPARFDGAPAETAELPAPSLP
ncbi:MAG: CoA transferase [Actinomycetota bacterium]|nr:CoA transferase [Actinomycetota bacterium]